jgi:hypothetical protein
LSTACREDFLVLQLQLAVTSLRSVFQPIDRRGSSTAAKVSRGFGEPTTAGILAAEF